MPANQSLENRRLLNPAFSGSLIVRACHGFVRESKMGLPYLYAYLILPLILHPETRERLPITITSRLSAWAERNSDLTPLILRRASELAVTTREALFLISTAELVALDDLGRLSPRIAERRLTNFENETSSEEVSDCLKKAHFVGRWLATAGTVPTVLTVLGVRL